MLEQLRCKVRWLLHTHTHTRTHTHTHTCTHTHTHTRTHTHTHAHTQPWIWPIIRWVNYWTHEQLCCKVRCFPTHKHTHPQKNKNFFYTYIHTQPKFSPVYQLCVCLWRERVERVCEKCVYRALLSVHGGVLWVCTRFLLFWLGDCI